MSKINLYKKAPLKKPLCKLITGFLLNNYWTDYMSDKAIADLSATALDATSIYLTWDDTSGIIETDSLWDNPDFSIDIYISENGVDYTLLDSLAGGPDGGYEIEYTSGSLNPETQYWYKLRYGINSITSEYSNAADATTNAE